MPSKARKSWSRTGLCVLFGMAFVWAALLAVSRNEPYYHDRPLSYWRQVARQPGSPDRGEAKRVFIEMLRDESEPCKWCAAQELGYFDPDPEVTRALTEALKDPDAATRRGAAWSLMFLKPKPAATVKALADATNDDDVEVRMLAGAATP